MGDAVIHMGPRGHFVQADGPVAVEMGIDAQIRKSLHPGVVPEALLPAVKAAAAAVGFH